MSERFDRLMALVGDGPTPRLIARESDGLVVLDKPAGWVVHRVGDATVPDVITWAQEALGLSKDFGAVHRLDKATSGVLLCAVGRERRAYYSAFFASGEVQKEYRALVYGGTEASFCVDRPLMDARRGRKLPAITACRRLRGYRWLSYLAVRPKTGRKHQIRRHLRGLGHPIVGDRRYGPRPAPAVLGFPGRMWLHAAWLGLPDGHAWEAPLPAALAGHLAALDAHEGVAGDEESEWPTGGAGVQRVRE